MPTTILADDDLGTVMNLLLIRFGILAIILFTVALTLKRKGKLGSAVRKAAPIAQSYADSRPARNQGGTWKTGATKAVALPQRPGQAGGPMTVLLADGNGHEILAELVHDYLMKAAIIAVLAIVVLIAMAIIWKKLGSRP
jgi:hypothetical protein